MEIKGGSLPSIHSTKFLIRQSFNFIISQKDNGDFMISRSSLLVNEGDIAFLFFRIAQTM
jgi:hypothetical protein